MESEIRDTMPPTDRILISILPVDLYSTHSYEIWRILEQQFAGPNTLSLETQYWQ
jgi:hypothetical protein